MYVASLQVLSVVACVGHLVFAFLVWIRGERTLIRSLLALLFLGAFAWNFADLARQVTGMKIWHAVDRFFSSFMPILALHLVTAFVGATRRHKHVLYAGYIVTLGLIATFMFAASEWWKALSAAAFVALVGSGALLLRHRRRTDDPVERARCDLIALAILIGTLFGIAELTPRDILPLPPLANVGSLIALLLMAVAVLRLRLLGRVSSESIRVYAALATLLGTLFYLSVSHGRANALGFWIMLGLVVVVVGIAVAREVGRSSAIERERTLRLAALGRFSEQLAHDLRNPIAALKGSLQFLAVERKLGRSLDAQAEFLDLMQSQVERLELTVEQYQRLARVETTKELISVNDVVERVIESQRFTGGSSLRVTEELDARVPHCEADRVLIATVVENLLRNAVEAMPKGGTLTVQTRLLDDLGCVELSVRDTGHGMDARTLERATDEFFTTKANGSGLGLSYAERVARAHGGSLAVESAVGRGTVVRFRLPVVL